MKDILSIGKILYWLSFLVLLILWAICFLAIWTIRRVAYIGLGKEKRAILKNLEKLRKSFGDYLSADEDWTRASIINPIAGAQVAAMQLKNEQSDQLQKESLVREASRLKIARWRLTLLK